MEERPRQKLDMATGEQTAEIARIAQTVRAKIERDRYYRPLINARHPELPFKIEVRLREALSEAHGMDLLNFNAAISDAVHQILVDLGQE